MKVSDDDHGGVAVATGGARGTGARIARRVDTLPPAMVETGLTASVRCSAAVYASDTERIPLKRPASPDEIAEVALFLGSPAASYVTGSNVVADGAWSVAGYPDLRPATPERRG